MDQIVPAARRQNDFEEYVLKLRRWFRDEARGFIASNAPEHLAVLDNDCDRLGKILARPEQVTVCFLGHSGIGKSTLLNAVAAGRDLVLPAGGIGPLTALATEVHYSEKPSLKVHYHNRRHLWRIAFALERMNERANTKSTSESAPSDAEIDEEDRQEIAAELEGASSSETAANVYVKQARQIVTGDQFSDRPLPYLIDCLRWSCGAKTSAQTQIDDADAKRLERVVHALELAEQSHPYVRTDSAPGFSQDLKDHAAGFLAPLIRDIVVGWPSTLLRAGVRLVDLPGVGIAQDAYRQVTKKFIRETARAVVLVVDRAGPTADTIELLRTSGYWDRLVAAADDQDSDPCSLLIAVTKVDDVASEEWRNQQEEPGRQKRRKREVYAELVEQFKVRMQAQVGEQLGTIGLSSNEAVSEARLAARTRILETLEVHPVSAPEYRKLLLDDEEERSFLPEIDDTGVPGLVEQLTELAERERAERLRQLHEIAERLRQGTIEELDRLEALRRDQTRAAQEAEALTRDLDIILEPKRKERDLRIGAFREFLDATAQTRIRELVLEARDVAEEEVRDYLGGLRNAHWATLRAAVRRGGAFYGTRAINLPDDIASKFQEPTAAVWSVKLLKEIKSRTERFAADQRSIVEEVCRWAEGRAELSTTQLLKNQRKRIERRAGQMNDVGKEAVTDLRKVVKQTLSDAIQKPIRGACDKFVNEGNDIGAGVKNRILELFEGLAKQATKAAETPARNILQAKFSVVRDEVRAAFDSWGDPLEETADLITQKYAHRVSQEDVAEREALIKAIAELRVRAPSH